MYAYTLAQAAAARSLSFRHGVFILYTPCHLPPQREARRLPPQATELQRCEPQLSPPTAGCPHPSRCSAKAQHRATFPKGKARAAAAASRRFAKVRTAVKPADGGLPSSVTVQRKSAAPRHLPQGEGKGGCRRKPQIWCGAKSITACLA